MPSASVSTRIDSRPCLAPPEEKQRPGYKPMTSSLDHIYRNARSAGSEERLVDIGVRDGRFAVIAPAVSSDAPNEDLGDGVSRAMAVSKLAQPLFGLKGGR